jgi:hypothetical protein
MGAIGLSTPEVYLEDIPLNLADIVIDIADGATAMATLTLSDPAAGALSTDTSGGVTSTTTAPPEHGARPGRLLMSTPSWRQ